MFKNITIQELKRLNNIRLIDIRINEKYNNGHIMNAINIKSEQLIINPSKYLSKNNKYYIYCQKGIQSVKTCQILSKNGYDVVNVLGGYEAWVSNSI